ncbi:hypothetical protein PENSPDRAFT_756261 [Peniophora sp. CONT]|nr:hypothetical protein PENSPDRAFT_756261 [Peniophora sp. CONT]
MDRDWTIYCIDRRAQVKGLYAAFPDFIFEGHDWVTKLLACPSFPDSKAPPSYYLAASVDKRHELGALSVIPMEIIGHIFSYLSSTDDAVSLAVAHRLLCHEGFRRVMRLRNRGDKRMGSWAGKRIIADEKWTGRELPKGMLTAEEEEEKKKTGGRWCGLSYWCWKVPQRPERHIEIMAALYGDIINPALQRVSSSCSGDYLRVRLLLEDTSPRYQSGATYALCNKDRNQCVRASALANMRIVLPSRKVVQERSSVDGPFLRGDKVMFDLGSLAIILTSWANPLIKDGPWAGERIGIWKVDNVPPNKLQDVSKWAIKIAKDCAKEMYNRRPR